MKYSVFVLALFLVGLVAGRSGRHGHHGRGIFGGRLQDVMEPRLGINVVRIIQIEKHIERIRERLEEAEHVNAERFLGEMDARISALEESPCGDHEFQCGGDDSHECISDLFVCDGHADCHNEHDEDDDVCSTSPVQAGHIFVGVMHWTSCLQWEDHVYRFTITSSRRLKAFSSRVQVKARSSFDVVTVNQEKLHYEYDMNGYYNFATRELKLYVEGESFLYSLYVNCHFNLGDDDRAECEFPFEGSEHTCATGTLVVENKEEDDDDDDDDDHHDAGHHGYYDTTHHDEKKDDDDDGHRDRDHDKDGDHDDNDRGHHRDNDDDKKDDDHHRRRR